MEPHLHRKRVRQLLTLIAVLLALCTLAIREFAPYDEPIFQIIGLVGWIVIVLGLLSLTVSFGREASNWLQKLETTDTEE